MALGRDRRQRRRRAAVIGGAAVAAKKHHDAKESQREEEAAASQQPDPGQAAEPAPAGGLTPETLDQLKQVGELHDQGVLSDEEFEREKAKLLGSA